MEFGTLVPQGWRMDLAGIADPREKWETVRRVSRGLDEAGWDSLWVYDHFHTFPQKRVEATFEAWMMMSALAEMTERARIGQFVTCVQYREPSYLAKIAACVDVASGGRLNVGVGSGWYAEEFEAYGYDFRTVGRRLARLREALDVLFAMWSEPMASYEGKHYRIVEAVCEPKPLQKPRPPIWIGGRGRKGVLRVGARAGGFHRCHAVAGRAVSAGRRWHPVSRRDCRAAALVARKAPAGLTRIGCGCRWLRQVCQHRRAGCGGDQQRSTCGG